MPKSKRTPKVDEEEMVDPAEMMFDEPAEHKHKKSHKHADPVVYAKKKHSTTKKGKSKSRPEEPEASLKHVKKARSTTNKKAPKKTVVDEPKAAAAAAAEATTTHRVKTAYLNFSSYVRDKFSKAMLPGWHDPTNKNPANVVFSAPLLFRISGMCWTVFGNKNIDFASFGAVIAFNMTKYISSPEGRARIAILRGKPDNDMSFPETHAALVEYIGKILAVYSTLVAPPFYQSDFPYIDTPEHITKPEFIIDMYETKKIEIEAYVAAKAAATDRALREAAELKASDTIKSARLDAADIFAATMAAAATTPIASSITVTPVAVDMTDAAVTEPIPPVVEALTPAAPAANTN
jgi:hypothetical protein